MSLITVIEPPLTNNQAFAGKNGKGSHLSYRSELPNLTSRFALAGGGDVADDKIDFVNDFMSTTSYFAQGLGTLELFFFGPSLFDANHVAMAGVNFQTADIRSIDFVVDFGSGDEVVKTFDTSSRVSFYDDKPFVLLLDNIITISNVRIVFNVGDAQIRPVEVSNLHVSKTLEFPNQPAIGFKKASWNTADEPRSSRRQNNEFGASTVKRQGTEERAVIPSVPYQFMDTDWTRFVKEFEYLPCFFSWDLLNFPLDTIYGNLTFNDVSYRSSLYSEISLIIKGIV